MACRISELVLACHDPEGLARFWCEVLTPTLIVFVIFQRRFVSALLQGSLKG